MSRKHGLWRFHYESTRARERFADLSIRWWVDGEIGKLYRMIDCLHIGYGRWSWSNADALVVCAKRYIRMYGGGKTVGEWNALIQKIADRAGFTHHATLNAACMYRNHRAGSPIFFHECNFGEGRSGRPFAKFSLEQIHNRHLSMLVARRDRINREREEELKRNRSLYEEVWLAKQDIAAINKAIKAAQAAIKEFA